MCDKHAQWGLLILRLALAVVFIYQGWAKLSGGIEGFAGMLAGIGLFAPMFFAWLVALIEFLGGILLLLGLWVRPVGFLLAIIMLVAWFTVTKSLPGAQINILGLGSALAIAMIGPGSYSLASKYCSSAGDAPAGGSEMQSHGN